ncbi:MAG: hypothetical protein ABJH04_07800 [Cyclobacteriaceae bacterium]
MDYKDLFANIVDGIPPKVRVEKPIKSATSNIGVITAVKWRIDGTPYGIEVNFPGTNWNTWFWSTPDKSDNRSRYIDELELHVE